ncbi:MAG: hypothetical protein PHQ23_03605 [Candidatus Wallbacteria bacterium]|nr:hypothetical protein [Candidatus Wallbacteria bacterium]
MRSFLPLIFFICLNYGLPAADITATLDSSDGTSGFSFRDSSAVEQVRIDSNGNLTVSGKVGLGISSPNTSLEISFNSPDTSLTGLAAYGGLHFDPSATNDKFAGITTSGTSSGTQGGILFQASGAYGTKIHFLTTDSYAAGMKNRMTLDHRGYLGIGTDNPSVMFEVKNGSSKLEQEAWIAPALQGAWSNYGGGWSTPGYYKDSVGTVHLKGLVQGGAVPSTIFTLPAGYRPIEQLIFAAITNGILGRIDVYPSGAVVANTPTSNGWVPLDNIVFRADN